MIAIMNKVNINTSKLMRSFECIYSVCTGINSIMRINYISIPSYSIFTYIAGAAI